MRRATRVPRRTEAIELVVPRAATISGTVVDPEGHPVERANVTVSQGSSLEFASGAGIIRGTGGDEIQTNADGRFRLEDLTPDEATLVASADGLADSAPT